MNSPLQRILPAAAGLLLLCSTVSCRSEQEVGTAPERERAHAHFTVAIDDIRNVVRTKSVLTDDDIETKLTSLTLAVYSSDGSLVEKKYVTSGFDDIRYMLDFGETFTIYAVANMGDLRASFPSAISGETPLADITYSIPSYNSGNDCISRRGIPMAGKLVYTVDGREATGEGQILLTRLFSKIQVHLACHWPGTFRTVKIHNLNKTLKPFGVSAALSGNDILGEQEIQILDTEAREGDFLFYVPENRQGSLPGIATSEEKGHDRDAVTGKDLKTYLEAVVTGVSADGVNGTMTYRSYLGNNDSSDFNIERNSRYVWSVDYYPGRMQSNDWKHENALSWKEFEYSLSAPSYLYLGESKYATLTTFSNNYENGTFVSKKQDDQTGIPSITYSVTPVDGSILGNPSVSGTSFRFRGEGPGTGTVTATCVDPFHPEGVILSQNVRVLDYGREIFLRTPSGDYYNGDTLPIPFGTTWEDIQVGMKKTLTNNTTQIICPVVIDSDNLNYGNVCYPSYSERLVDYADYSGDQGKALVFSHTFTETPSPYTYIPNQFNIYLYYTDYGSEPHQIPARINVELLDADAELITVSSDKDEAYWVDGSISLTAQSTSIHNGVSGVKTDITASNDYQWTVTGSAPGMNPQLSLIGDTRILTASQAGTATVTVTKKSDGTVSASKVVTFNDKITYRLDVTPKTRNVKTGDSFQTDEVFTINQVRYVNGTYHSSEPFTGTVYWSVKSGSSSYLRVTGSLHPVTVTAKTEGTGYLRAYTFSSAIESGYGENEITVNIGQADNYTVALTPGSLSVKEGEHSPALGFDVRNNGTPVSGLSASDLNWHTKNSSVATVSAGVVTGVTAGSTQVYATYAGAVSNEVDVTVASADAITHRYKVVTTVTPQSIRLGGTASASALRFKKTYVNDVATTDWEADGDVTSSGFAELGNTGKVTLSGSTLTAVATGTATIKSLYVADEYENATLSIFENSLELTLDKGSLSVNGNAQASVSFRSDNGASITSQDVTGSATIQAYTSASGSTLSTLVTIGADGTVTGKDEGDCWLEATYSAGEDSYTSNRVKVTVRNNPLQLNWSDAGAAQYVAQRGLLEVLGLDDSSASVSFMVTSGADKVSLAQSGNNTYVSLLGSGSYTIQATASNGQTGTFAGSVSAPVLTPVATTLYANPDGSFAHTESDGLTGNTLTVSYKAGTTSLTTTTEAIAVGNHLYKELYDQLLDLQYSSSDFRVHAGSDGIYATDVYEASSGATISTVTISPKVASTGVSSVALYVKGVNPFGAWDGTVTVLPDEDDFGLINKYRRYAAPSYDTREFEKPRITATSGQCGIEIFRNGNILTTAALRACFSSSYDATQLKWTTSYKLSESALSEHVAGLIELKGYVRNIRSNNYIYKDGAKFGVYVNGAIGARMSGIGTSEVTISTAFAGNEADYGFGLIGTTRLIGTRYSNGDTFGYITDTSIVGIPEDGSPINSKVYTLHRDGAILDSADKIMEAEKPRFKFLSVGTIGVFIDDDLGGFYYLQPAGTPTVEDGSHGYFKLWLLESIDVTHLSGPKQGWILD